MSRELVEGSREDRVRCELCGHYFRAITWTHLRKGHGVMDVDDYKARFQLRFVTSQATRQLYSEVRIEWTPGLVLRRIRERYERGESLAHRDVIQEDAGLAHFATRFFGYREAITAAGLDYAEVSHPLERRKWTEPKIIERIRQYDREGRPLNIGAVLQYDQALVVGSRNFGGWRTVLEKAGISWDSIRHGRSRYTRNEALNKLRELASECKLVGSQTMRHDPELRSLFFACATYWGRLPGAARAAGIETQYHEQVDRRRGRRDL